MRFSVRWLDVCPGEEKRILRKGAFWLRTLTERRTLRARTVTSPAQNALFREGETSKGRTGMPGEQSNVSH